MSRITESQRMLIRSGVRHMLNRSLLREAEILKAQTKAFGGASSSHTEKLKLAYEELAAVERSIALSSDKGGEEHRLIISTLDELRKAMLDSIDNSNDAEDDDEELVALAKEITTNFPKDNLTESRWLRLAGLLKA